MSNLLKSSSDDTTCRAKGLPICDPHESSSSSMAILPYKKIEPAPRGKTLLCDCIFRSDQRVSFEEEQTTADEESSGSEKQLSLEDILNELKKYKAIVNQIDKKLQLNVSDCSKAKKNICKYLSGKKRKHLVHSDINQVHKDNLKLPQQLKMLQDCCKDTNDIMKKVHNEFQESRVEAYKIQLKLNELDSFKRTMEHEHTLCLQRYQYLMKEQYEWEDSYKYIESRFLNAERENLQLVLITDYKIEKRKTTDTLNKAKLKVKQLYDDMMQRKIPFKTEFGSVIASFLQHNEHLFKRESH